MSGVRLLPVLLVAALVAAGWGGHRLDRAAIRAAARPTPTERGWLGRVGRAKPRQRSAAMRAGLLLAVAIGATACTASSASGREGRYVDSLGWSLRYPRGVHLERSHASLRIDVSEVTVASFAMRRAVHSGSTADGGWLRVDPPRDRHGRFPADGVAFRLLRREGGPGPDIELLESRLPLLRASFARAARSVVAAGGCHVPPRRVPP